MKKIKIISIIISSLLTIAILINMTGCVLKVQAADLMEGIVSTYSGTIPEVNKTSAEKATDFALRLFKSSNQSDKNTLVSPLSVLAALSMTANGAKGTTKTQMEQVLGMSTDELNIFFKSYMNSLKNNEFSKLKLANSIWFTSDARFSVNKDFLQTNANYYEAGAYKAPFDDTTLKDINNWVYEHTDGMISDILDKIPEDAIMYLVNALAFESKWKDVYTQDQIRKGNFTNLDGSKATVDFMHSIERNYLEDGKATGFVKYYEGKDYAFVALLPNVGISVEEYISSLTGKHISDMLSNSKSIKVEASIPKFETSFDIELSGVLRDMGMTDAFSSQADFSGLGHSSTGNISISRVIHNTFLSLTENGTKAGAATVVEMRDEAYIEPSQRVYLDRPFVYMLIETETNTPLFIGSTLKLG